MAGAMLALSGCQSYTARPVDLAGHRAAWMQRHPGSAETAGLVRALSQGPGDDPLDAADGLSLPEGELVALVYNPELRVARLRAGVALATAEHAGLWDDPVLGGNLARFVQSGAHPWMVMTTLGVTLPVSGRLGVEKRRAGAEHGAAIARVYEQEWLVRMEVRRAWARWGAAAQRARVMREYLGSLSSLVEVVGKLEEAGELPAIDARFFRIEAAVRRNELVQMEAMEREAGLMLRQVMGLSPGAEVALSPGVPGDAGAADPEGLMERSPALAVAVAEYEVAERALELEVRRQYPDIMAGPGYEREEGMDKGLLMFEVPLPAWNRNKGGIARARAERELSRAMVESALERVESQLAQARVMHGSASARRGTLEREIAPLVDRQYADALKVAELGEVNTLALLEALSRQQEVRMSLIEAWLEEALAAVRVAELMGPAAPKGVTP